MKVKINDKLIGEEEPCFIIAEAGVNHNGSVELAKKLIDAAKDAGVDSVNTRMMNYLTAENLARYFIANLPEDYVPYWDFDDPGKEVKDSSAGAIAASGLLDLSDLSEKEEFREVAINILSSLCDNYLSLSAKEKDGILKHGCYHKPAGIGVDESLIWIKIFASFLDLKPYFPFFFFQFGIVGQPP